MIDGLENQNISQSNNQSNQFASQVNDPQLFDTMKKVIERNKEKVILDEKKEEEDEIEKQGEDKDLLPNKGGGFHNMVICGEYTGIFYDDAHIRDGVRENGTVMEFVRFKEYGEELGTRVVVGWGGTKGNSYNNIDYKIEEQKNEEKKESKIVY